MIQQRKKKTNILAYILGILSAIVIIGCAIVVLVFYKKVPDSTIIKSKANIVLGTVCSINLYEDGKQEIYDELFNKLDDIDMAFSVTRADSQLSHVNQAAGIKSVEVGDDVLYVLKKALSYAVVTDGAFDPTIGPLVKLWGINTDHARVPSDKEIEDTLKLINYKDVIIDGNKVFLTKAGMSLDLGGIAKGYAADELVRIIKAHGVKKAIINLGGNIYVYGKKEDKSLWSVGVKDPENQEGDPALVLKVEENSVVTSGVYERFFIQDKVRYHHILSPKTGRPADSGLMSTTIVCKSSTDADALSTSIFILGLEDGFTLLEKMNIAAGIFITNDRNVYATSDLKESLVSSNYKYTKINYK
ncbi:MAG: FAD:protein FMN transferase [Treponema sp.]|nr:FAD:protein FMN transferase [Treponema sp.]